MRWGGCSSSTSGPTLRSSERIGPTTWPFQHRQRRRGDGGRRRLPTPTRSAQRRRPHGRQPAPPRQHGPSECCDQPGGNPGGALVEVALDCEPAVPDPPLELTSLPAALRLRGTASPPTCFASAKTTVNAPSTEDLFRFLLRNARATTRFVCGEGPRGPQLRDYGFPGFEPVAHLLTVLACPLGSPRPWRNEATPPTPTRTERIAYAGAVPATGAPGHRRPATASTPTSGRTKHARVCRGDRHPGPGRLRARARGRGPARVVDRRTPRPRRRRPSQADPARRVRQRAPMAPPTPGRSWRSWPSLSTADAPIPRPSPEPDNSGSNTTARTRTRTPRRPGDLVHSQHDLRGKVRRTSVLRALVNAIGDGNNDPFWRSEVDRMDVRGDLFLSHEMPNDPRGIP